jgi:hypothetical protein
MASIYFISDGEYVKIGQSIDVNVRMGNLQCSNARQLVILYTVECPASYLNELEHKFHSHFYEYLARGEWFKLNWESAKQEIAVIEAGASEEIHQAIEAEKKYKQEWMLKTLQMRFDQSVDDDIAQNYPPLKHPKRISFQGKKPGGFGRLDNLIEDDDDDLIFTTKFQSRFSA